jgi:kynurenine formamidase
MSIIDLSVELSPEFPCWWPDLEPFTVTTTSTLEATNTFSRNMHLEEHAGTHFDAPCHTGDNRFRPYSLVTGDALPIADLIGRARVIDVRSLPTDLVGASSSIGTEVLMRYEEQCGEVIAGDAVLLFSGWSDRHYRPFPAGNEYVRYPLDCRSGAWPSPAPSFIEALATRGVKLIGVDCPSVGGLPDLALAHQAAFRCGITPIENLVNLGSLIGREATFVFLPLRVTGSSGCPGRAVAFVMEGVSRAN